MFSKTEPDTRVNSQLSYKPLLLLLCLGFHP